MMAEMARVIKPNGLMIQFVPWIMSALHTLVHANIAAAVAPQPPRRWSLREWLRPKSQPQWIVPQLHSRIPARQSGLINLYLTDSYVHGSWVRD